MKISIIADNREKGSGIPELLLNQLVDVQMSQLSVGDYIINDEIAIVA